jgi:hypothetical protein
MEASMTLKKIFAYIAVSGFMMTVVLSLLVGCRPRMQKVIYGKIGTGDENGLYYEAGVALAELVNERTDQHHFDLAVQVTGGSVVNINDLVVDELALGFAQADQEYQAYHGEGEWEGDPQKNLRFICTLYPEMVTLLVANGSGINALADVKGKMISIGMPGSGTWENALDVLSAINLEPDTDFQTENASPNEAVQLLQGGTIDAFFYTVGHPNQITKEATEGVRPVHFVPITGMETLMQKDAYYSTMEIDYQLYPKATNTANIPTIGMRTRLLTSTDASEQLIYTVTKTLFENLAIFKNKNPAFAALVEAQMVQSAFAPIHPGALRYYKEVGLIK